MTEEWVEISIRAPGALTGIIGKYLVDIGSAGFVEDTLELKVKDNSVSSGPAIKSYFRGNISSNSDSLDTIRKFVLSLQDIFPEASSLDVSIRELSREDWEGWKRFFRVTHISERVVIKPTWEEYRRKGDEIVVDIDPGMAFGTGTHETTRMCIRLLDQIMDGGETVLDVGAGSGILSITAAKLGAIMVTAIDIDANSVVVAGENVKLNRVGELVDVSGTALEDIKDRFDIVVANILAEDLAEMSRVVVDRLDDGGRLILSGILISKTDMVIDAYERVEMKLEGSIEEGDWSALLFIK